MPCAKPASPPTMGIQHSLAFHGAHSISLLISGAAGGTVVAPWEWECQLVLSAEVMVPGPPPRRGRWPRNEIITSLSILFLTTPTS